MKGLGSTRYIWPIWWKGRGITIQDWGKLVGNKGSSDRASRHPRTSRLTLCQTWLGCTFANCSPCVVADAAKRLSARCACAFRFRSAVSARRCPRCTARRAACGAMLCAPTDDAGGPATRELHQLYTVDTAAAYRSTTVRTSDGVW